MKFNEMPYMANSEHNYFDSKWNNFVRAQLITDTIIAPINAAGNALTEKPLIIVPKYQKSKPLITRENNPSVTILIGRVSTLIIGLINILNNVRHAPTIKDTQIGLTVIPDTTYVVSQTASDSIIQWKIIRIKFKLRK
jgi:hypothetical protein